MSAADIVFTGTVNGVTQESIKGEPFNLYRLGVSTVFKGSAFGEVIVSSSSQSSCGVRFAVGEQYLVFAFEQDGSLYTNYCMGNRLLGDSAVDLTYLGRPDDLSIYGRVLEYGSANDSVGHLPVVVTSGSDTWRLTTSTDGRFELGGLVPATYVVRLVSTGICEPGGSPDTLDLEPGACGEVVQLVRRVQHVDPDSPISFGLVRVEGGIVPGPVHDLVSQTLQLSPLDDIGPILSIPIDRGSFRFVIHAGQAIKVRVRGVSRSGDVHFGPWAELPVDRNNLFGRPDNRYVTVSGP